MKAPFFKLLGRVSWLVFFFEIPLVCWAGETVVGWGWNGLSETDVPAGLSNVVAIAAGSDNSLALKNDGTVVAWGSNSYGERTPPAGLSNVVAIAAGASYAMALKSDGTVVAWGYNAYNQAIVPAGLSNVVAIAAGAYHSLALKRDGTVVAWGLNDYGQTNVPAGLSNVVAISAGEKHSLALKKEGTVVAWGSNYDYQGGYEGQTTVPAGLSNIVAIAAGGYHNLLLKNDGTVLAWGHNYGPVVTYSGQAIVPAGLSNVVAVAGGGYHSLALKSDGTIVEWGDNYYGQMNMPAGLSNVVAIAGGDFFSLALLHTGPPLILRQPVDQATFIGLPVNFNITAAGPPPLAYQWQFNGADIPGATNASLSFANPQTADSGTYNAVVTNSYGSVTSSNANLTVSPSSPIIINQPQDQSVLAGSNVLLSVTAAGSTSLTYQWRQNGTNLYGATDALLLLANAQPPDTGFYDVLVSNSLGCATSRQAILMVYAPPVIDQQPTNRTVLVGSPTTLAVSAQSLPPVSFQWQFNGTNIAGATNATFTLGAVGFGDAGSYQVIVSNPFAAQVSEIAVLAVIDGPPTIVTDPASQETYLGGPATFQVVAGGTPPLQYQWQFGGTNLAGATNSNLAFALVTTNQAGKYSVVLSNAFGTAVSREALLVIGPVLAWGDDSDGQTNLPPGLTNTIAIATRYGHNLALRSDGTVLAWGRNIYGQCNVPLGLSNVLAIDAGDGFSLALKRDGRVVAWGGTNWGQLNMPEGLSNVVAIAAGDWHGLALKSDGTVVGWGRNDFGQASVPSGLTNVVALSAGYYHSLALKNDGTVVGWGRNVYGQAASPKGLSNVVAIAAGFEYNLALRSDGTVAGWGYNTGGQATVPAGLSNAVAIAAGGAHSLAVQGNGSVVGWGSNGNGQINIPAALHNVIAVGAGWIHSLALFNQGPPVLMRQPFTQTNYSGTTVTLSSVAIGPDPLAYQWQFNGAPIADATNAVLMLTNIQPVDAGSYSVTVASPLGTIASSNATLAVVVSRPVLTTQPVSQTCFLGPNASNITFTVSVAGSLPLSYQWQFNGTDIPGATASSLTLTNAQLTNRGLYHVVVSNTVGTLTSADALLGVVPVVAWGYNYSGQTNVPPAATNVVAVAGGQLHCLAMRAEGTLIGWGVNSSGQTNVPAAATNVVAIAAGANHNLALRAGGTVIAWGDNSYTQTNVPSSATNVVAIAAGGSHNLALKADGTVIAWGNNSFGQINVPSSATNVVALAGGSTHSLALRADGTVIGWGYNGYGQISIPSATTNVVAIAAGLNHSLALRADGSVLTWGYSSYGLSNIPAGATNVAAIAAGGYHSLALRADGALVSWGDASYSMNTVPSGVTNAIAVAAGQYHNLAVLGDGSPRIISQPWSRTINAGTRVVLSAPAVGAFPLTYQWQRNGTNIPGATTAAWVLSNVGPANSGHYAVVVTNYLGGVTSAVVSVNLAPTASSTTAATRQNQSISIPIRKLLLFASDPDGDLLALSGVSATSTNGGNVVLSGNAVTYTPATNYTGADRFTYTVSDGRGGIASAYVLVSVTAGTGQSANMFSPANVSGGVLTSFAGILGRTYTVQRAPSPSGPWTTSGTATVGSDGIGSLLDANPPPDGAFYRTTFP